MPAPMLACGGWNWTAAAVRTVLLCGGLGEFGGWGVELISSDGWVLFAQLAPELTLTGYGLLLRSITTTSPHPLFSQPPLPKLKF